jgi:hypothetical protein
VAGQNDECGILNDEWMPPSLIRLPSGFIILVSAFAIVEGLVESQFWHSARPCVPGACR